MAALRLIVGLGNPGAEHLRTRHNAGFWFIDALAQREGARFGFENKLHAETAKVVLDGQTLWLLKPTTFMNKSGIAIASALRYWKIEPEEMLVAHDDLDLPPGAARLKFDGGHGGQNGLRDIFAHLVTASSTGCAWALAIRDTRIVLRRGCSVARALRMRKRSSALSARRSMCCRWSWTVNSTRQ